MWDLGHRAAVALVSVLSGCVFLYNVWGTILILTISLFLTIYACYSLIINDSLLSPHAFHLLHYCKHVSFKVRLSLESVVDNVYRYTRTVWETAHRRYRDISLTETRMDKHRGARYQISANHYSPRKNSSRFPSIAHLSPIPDTSQRLDANDVESENKFYHSSDHSLYDRSPFNKHTSTPMFQWRKDELEDQPGKLLPSDRTPPKGISASYVRNHTSTRGENATYFTVDGSPWGTSISPKVHPKMNEARAAQTVSGPLLASNRYNIDQKVYNDVTSPGLTARLTKYATEASSKLITHQSQYRVGQFPKVNLQASPVPLINARSAKTRTPVTVRVAPPGKQRFLSDLYNAEGTCDSPLVLLDSRELSLKRHASREDVASDLAKKQRTDSIVSNELEAPDETKQKRSRESSKSEEDTSPQNKTARPMKRTKTPSCYDILNSLSSSKHVISGVKRKARDLSRSGTPDFEKHFKSLECVQSTRVQTSPETRNVTAKYWSPDVMEKSNSVVRNSPDVAQQPSPLKGILKTRNKSPESSSREKENEVHAKFTDTYNENDQSTESVASTADESAKLTNKLFMRAEPERNQKLRMLVEEQGNIRAKFTTDDVDEIKKEDIADMRQTSIKARLQSMFDAISGRAASRINPDVVIQAEELNAVKSVSSPVTCVTLNSSTITTNANTTPISTSAVAPSPTGTNKSGTKTPKHVAFNLPAKEISSNSNVSATRTEALSIPKPDSTPIKPAITFTTASGIAPVPSAPSPVTTSSNLNVPNVDFAKAASTTVTNTSSSGTFTFRAASSNEKATTSTTPQLTTSTNTDHFGSVAGSMAKISPGLITSGLIDTKSEVNRNNSPIPLLPAGNVSSSSTLGAFGGGNVTVCSANVNAVTPTITSAVENTGQYSGIASVNSNLSASASTSPITSAIPFKSIASAGSSSFPTITPANTSAAPLFSFGNKISSSQASKPEPFVFGSAGNASQSTNAFESLTNPQQASTTSNAIANKNATFSQNSGTPNTVISSAFASNAKPTVSPFGSSATSFSFGTSTHSGSSNGRPGFSFGTTTSTTNPLTGTSNTTVYGTEKNHPSSTFVTSPDNSTTAQFRPTASSIFGNASSGPSIFGTASSQPAVGAPSTVGTTAASFATVPPKSVVAPGFGSNAVATFAGSKSTNSPTVFSNTTGGSSLGISATTSTPIFGSIPITSAPGVIGTSGNLFSNANPTAPITSTTSASSFRPAGNIFGQAKAPAANFKSAAEVFGNNATGSLFGSQATTTTTTPVFGGTNVSSNAATTFGSTNASSNVTVPTFGPTSTAPSAFGSQNNNPAFGSSSSMFGAENLSTPAFGTSTGNGPFNPPVSSTTFGGQNATSLTFGAPKSLVAFGDNKPSPFAPQTSAFGTPATHAPTFGTSNATTATNNTSNIFTFGANQKPPQQNTTTFSFGSNSSTNNNNSGSSNANNNNNNNNNNNINNNAAGSTPTPFQFGATTPKPATGFNFSTPTTTPSINFGTTSSPPFNAAAPGMFNIGSGSTAPRSRNVRTRKPR